MATTAKMRPLTPPPGRMPQGARPVAHAPHHKGGALTNKEITPQELKVLVVQGTLVGTLLIGILAVAYFFFGDALRANFLPIAGVSSPAAATSGPGPTVFYRDRGDGTVTVLEIDGNGTRVKGTIDRVDVPLLQADKVREGWGSSNTSPNSRVNALGSSFR